MNENLPSNSNKYRDRQKKEIKPVVKGEVKAHKKSLGRKVTETVFNSDLKTAKSHIVNDFIIPSIRDFIFDGLHDFIDTLFGGDAGRSYSRRPSSISKTSYEKYYYKSGGGASKPSSNYVSSKSAYEVYDIIFDERGEAERVLDELRDILNEYPTVSVNDYYELVGKTNELGSSTDPDYGWTNLDRVNVTAIRRGRERGYIINLPRTEYLK